MEETWVGPGLGFVGLILFIGGIAWVASRMRRENDEVWSRVAGRYGLVAERGLFASGVHEGRSVTIRGFYEPVRHKRLPRTMISVTLLHPLPEPGTAKDQLAGAFALAARSGCKLQGSTLVMKTRGFLTKERDLDDAIALAVTLARQIDDATRPEDEPAERP